MKAEKIFKAIAVVNVIVSCAVTIYGLVLMTKNKKQHDQVQAMIEAEQKKIKESVEKSKAEIEKAIDNCDNHVSIDDLFKIGK